MLYIHFLYIIILKNSWSRIEWEDRKLAAPETALNTSFSTWSVGSHDFNILYMLKVMEVLMSLQVSQLETDDPTTSYMLQVCFLYYLYSMCIKCLLDYVCCNDFNFFKGMG